MLQVIVTAVMAKKERGVALALVLLVKDGMMMHREKLASSLNFMSEHADLLTMQHTVIADDCTFVVLQY